MIPFLVEMKAIHDETESDPAWQDDRFDPPTRELEHRNQRPHGGRQHHRPAEHLHRLFPADAGPKTGAPARPGPGGGRSDWASSFEVLGAAPPLFVDPNSELVSELLAIVGAGDARTVTYGTDGTQFTALKKLAVFGPGNIAQAHTFDEWIALEQLERGTQLYERAIQRWCC